MYLDRQSYCIYGLALIGVRAVLSVNSERGSPFNIQRSLHVPNFTLDEVTDLFDQYQQESGQVVEPEVSQSMYESTKGQPGLVGWFGELLTEKYNPGQNAPIDASIWNTVLCKALFVEWNNTVFDLVKKVRSGYVPHIQKLFSSSSGGHKSRYKIRVKYAKKFPVSTETFGYPESDVSDSKPSIHGCFPREACGSGDWQQRLSEHATSCQSTK
jgi:hypothetical protein